ncbi:MAG: hypothetical protein HC882_05985 [Acidobacteria bacterium]|nr:hypothetical protein [Acidobacteriota bacterium]
MSTRAKWRDHVHAWRASGQTAASYGRRNHLNPRTLSWWAWKLAADGESEQGEDHRTRPSFVELAPLELASGHFELEVTSLVIRVPFDFDALALGRLLDLLEARR